MILYGALSCSMVKCTVQQSSLFSYAGHSGDGGDGGDDGDDVQQRSTPDIVQPNLDYLRPSPMRVGHRLISDEI